MFLDSLWHLVILAMILMKPQVQLKHSAHERGFKQFLKRKIYIHKSISSYRYILQSLKLPPQSGSYGNSFIVSTLRIMWHGVTMTSSFNLSSLLMMPHITPPIMSLMSHWVEILILASVCRGLIRKKQESYSPSQTFLNSSSLSQPT